MRYFGLAILMICLGACASKPKPKLSSEQAISALKAQSAQIKTVMGTIHIVIHSKEGSISFPAEVAVDRTVMEKPQLRLAAEGPMGVTYALLVLNASRVLTWVDFDKHVKSKIEREWQGLPLEELPDLLLGIAPLRENWKTVSNNQDAFEVESDFGRIAYGLKWFEDGGKPVVSDLKSERYEVKFKDHFGAREYYLPREIEIRGKDGLYVRVNWRERKWNEKIPAAAFSVPQTDF